MLPDKRADVIAGLQSEILRLQGLAVPANKGLNLGLGPIADAFPNSSFPVGAIHEFLSESMEDVAATSGFISGVLSSLMRSDGVALWISSSRKLFPPALKSFGLEPDRFIFIDLKKESDVLWAMDEALKCGALSAVVGEVREISFTASRRLQLAVEQSQVTGFLLRSNYKSLNTTACVSRWRITSLPGEIVDDLPGIGFPKWRVELSRIRNGKAGTWDICWTNGAFKSIDKSVNDITPLLTDENIFSRHQRNAG